MPTTTSVVDKQTECQRFTPADQPVSIAESRRVPPVTVKRGTCFGLLILTSDPRSSTFRIHGWPCTCTWGTPSSRKRYEELNQRDPDYFPAWPEADPFPPPCSRTVQRVCADVRCQCGTEIRSLPITGDSHQRFACGVCYRRIRYARPALDMVA